MTREVQGLEEGPNAEMHKVTQNNSKKINKIGKRRAMMDYMVSGSRNSPPFTTD